MICPGCKDVFLEVIRIILRGQLIEISRTERRLEASVRVDECSYHLTCPACHLDCGSRKS